MKNKIKLIKPMYECQNMPIVVFEDRCPKPCLYCDLCTRSFPKDKIIASGTKDILLKLKDYNEAYFSGVTDCFLEENKNFTHNLLKNTWRINKDFVPLIITKQAIPNKTIELLKANKHRVTVLVSIPSLNDKLLSLVEPGAASVSKRLMTIKKLTKAGIYVVALVMPWFNIYEDGEKIEDLPRKLAEIGIKKCAIGTGVLPEQQRRKFIETGNKSILKAVKGMTEKKQVATKIGYTIPFKKRIILFKKMVKIFDKYGIKTRICTADNPDLINNTKLPLCTKSNHPVCSPGGHF